jgi:hypothetical protein
MLGRALEEACRDGLLCARCLRRLWCSVDDHRERATAAVIAITGDARIS